MDDRKKKPREPEEDQVTKETEEEIEKWMEQLSQEGLPKGKIIRVKMPKRTPIFILLETLLMFLINILLFLSLTGFFEWAVYESILDLIYFILIFTGIELILKNAIHLFFPKLIIKSFGLLLMIPPFVALPLGLFLASSWVHMHSLGLLILSFVILLIIRSVFRNILINLPRRK